MISLKKKILFIVNPISGGRNKSRIPGLIMKFLDTTKFEYRISFSERVGHAQMLSKAAVKEEYDIVVAVGGDGTVNEVATGIVGTDTLLGIIPFGSGNGLARTLKIPMSPARSIGILNKLNTDKIDSARLNTHNFFNMAGTGFDAHISHAFASDKKRGLGGYVRSVFRELANYKPAEYQILIDGKEMKRKAFIVSVANSSQYGNEAHIAPAADVKDGLLDVVIVKPFPWYMLPLLAMRMFTRTADRSSYVESHRGREIHITGKEEAAIHLDGEPRMEQKELSITVNPLSLNVIIP